VTLNLTILELEEVVVSSEPKRTCNAKGDNVRENTFLKRRECSNKNNLILNSETTEHLQSGWLLG
jgi:hypothetical protein